VIPAPGVYEAMKKKLFITDERMFKLMDWAIENNMVATESEFLDQIGFTRNNINKVKSGTQGFRKEHILSACNLTGASADYIFGLTNTMMRKPAKRSLDLLKEAVIAVEHELKNGKG
jgi:hypothetical protein